jgi:hypothetical protein
LLPDAFSEPCSLCTYPERKEEYVYLNYQLQT